MPEQSTLVETTCRPWSSPASNKSLIFYKLIVPSIIQDKKLKIPDKLAKKIRDELSSVATLSVPNGRVWCMGLKTIGNKIWFDTGWQEFVEHYSICEGHFLVFSYQGGSNFNIHLFDLTTSEINYTSKALGNSEELTHDKQCPVPHKEGLTGDDSIKVVDSDPCSTPSSLKSIVIDQCVNQQTPSENSKRPSLRDLIKAYEESVFGFKKEDINAASFDGCGTIEDNQHLTKNPQNSQASVSFIRNVSLKSSEVKLTNHVYNTTGECLHLANNGVNLQRRFRFYQDIGIQCSESELTNLTDEVGLHLQGEAKQRFERSKRQTQRTELSEHEPSTKRKKEKEMNGMKKNSRISTRTRSVTNQEKQSAIDAATTFKPSKPSCKVILKPSYVYRGFLLHIPFSFGKKYLSEVSGMIKLQDSDGKQWPVRCVNHSGKTKLSKGWLEFVKDNDLEEGDVCIFELIQVKDVMLKVTIFRVIEDIAEPTPPTSK